MAAETIGKDGTEGLAGPFTNFNFTIEIDGIPETGFCSLEGLESTIEGALALAKKREGARGRLVARLP
jgi:hypothetical protein